MKSAVCQLCGQSGTDVATAVVRWRPEFTTGRTFEAIPRCKDHRACQRRLVDIGDVWPLDEPWDRDELVLA